MKTFVEVLYAAGPKYERYVGFRVDHKYEYEFIIEDELDFEAIVTAKRLRKNLEAFRIAKDSGYLRVKRKVGEEPVYPTVQEEEPPLKDELTQGEFKFESTNFRTFLMERTWMELFTQTEPYEYEDSRFGGGIPGGVVKTFDVVDKDGRTRSVIVTCDYGPINIGRGTFYTPRIPDNEIRDIAIKNGRYTNGIIYQFGTDLEMVVLNVFDRLTTVKLIATVYHIMMDYYDQHRDAEWALFGGYTNERSKMRMYDAISNELAQHFGFEKKVFQGNNSNETYYLLYKG